MDFKINVGPEGPRAAEAVLKKKNRVGELPGRKLQ